MIVCFSNLDWGYLRYRKQHLMARLARSGPVVYVNPPRAVKWRAPWRAGVSTPQANLRVVEPLVLPGVRRSPRVKAANDRLIASTLKRIGGGRPDVLWIYSPHATPFIDRLQPSLVVYDIADDYTAPGGAAVRDADEALELQTLDALERQLLARADLVLCVSEPLAAKARSCHGNVHLVPNGCDYDRYADPAPRAVGAFRPCIGYVGTIAPRVDLELLFELARLRPDWDFDLVGPVTTGVCLDMTLIPPNVYLLGAVPYDRVAEEIDRFDVGILPLRNIPFATSCSPIQVYDYLAAGKPVVATPIDQLRAMGPLVATASDAAGFAARIAQALSERDQSAVDARRAFARANSWDVRVGQIERVLRAAQANAGVGRARREAA